MMCQTPSEAPGVGIINIVIIPLSSVVQTAYNEPALCCSNMFLNVDVRTLSGNVFNCLALICMSLLLNMTGLDTTKKNLSKKSSLADIPTSSWSSGSGCINTHISIESESALEMFYFDLYIYFHTMFYVLQLVWETLLKVNKWLLTGGPSFSKHTDTINFSFSIYKNNIYNNQV